jgi:hypothetical protein
MKKVLNKSILAMAFMASSLASSATGKIEDSLKIKSDTPVEFKYVGKMDDQPLFQLNLNNADVNEYIITLRDENGTTIYDEKITGKDVSRKYMLNLNEIDASEIRIQVKNKTDNSVSNFTVKRNFSLIDEWALK